ncbi:hypothetical protein FEM48_Zijuj05G0089300 [Ziziphus jujuba var. spinosa]|uniref:Pentatricopeptide repeat-containing protein n=1 Tax=Ziziphus jujuba var. spinosa TaxID=714518 RepID=A0A978VE12_ZIZJJ|nr:hypothetical protein FEM48_Zijuj05G0089300 [Ziziphus jujuba var. spinosa]
MRGSSHFRKFHGSCSRSLQTQPIGGNKLLDTNISTSKPIPSKKTLTQKHHPNNKLSSPSEADIVKWNMAITTHMRDGRCEAALRVFNTMPRRSSVSYNTMISGYLSNDNSWNTMITGYSQNNDIAYARVIFDRMPHRDSISWAAIIAGYAQNGQSEEALHLFLEMKREGERLTRSCFTCALSTCADIAALETGKQLHGRVVKVGYETGCYVGNALLVMYCKCGSIEEAYGVFKGIAEKDVVSWNTMIAGYARHGYGKEALDVFESMKAAGIKPDDVTLGSTPR